MSYLTKVHLTFIFNNHDKKIKEKDKRHSKSTADISICQAENEFSLDELVKKLADTFENKVSAEILKMNLQLTQEVLMHRTLTIRAIKSTSALIYFYFIQCLYKFVCTGKSVLVCWITGFVDD